MTKLRVMLGWVALLGVIGCGARKTGNMKMPASGTMMAGDSMAMMATALLPRVRANLDSLESAMPALRDSALSHHAAVLEGLLHAMRTDLMHLGLHRNPAYLALADSAGSDTAAIGAAPPADRAMAAQRHAELIKRLLAVYEQLVARGMH